MAIPLNQTQLFKNNAVSLLALPISDTDTSLTVITGHGALFPQPTGDGSDYFLITLEDQSALTREIIKVTGRIGDVFTFDLADRAQEGTTAHNWSASLGSDTLVDHRITAETLTRAMQLPISSSVIPGSDVYDANCTITTQASTTIVTLPTNYAANSVRVWLGGLRQKRGFDFVESGPGEITLLCAVTTSQIADGLNIVVDYSAA